MTNHPVYRLLYKQPVEKELRKLPQTLRIALIAKIEALTQEPRPTGTVKLHGSTDLYRIRQGDYRVVYQIRDGELIVLVLKVGHRRDVYQDL